MFKGKLKDSRRVENTYLAVRTVVFINHVPLRSCVCWNKDEKLIKHFQMETLAKLFTRMGLHTYVFCYQYQHL